tara:strand:+ start:4579 stop:5454 length:876 start_codon:yes stop_codon:yes gene_type:complete
MTNKKTLDNLVDNIYNKLDDLNKGKSLGITKKQADAFGKAMSSALLEWSKPYKKEKGSTLRMSNIGKADRKLWYEANHELKDTPNHPSTYIKFLYGHLLEELVIMLVRLAGYEVTDQQKEVVVEGVKGHMDCKINGEVIDIKSASSFSFKKFKEKTLPENDPFGYIGQISGYEAAEKTNKGGFLVIDKSTGAITLYRPDEFDKVDAKKRIKGLKKTIKKKQPPPRCHDPIPSGSSGNMALPRDCFYCPFKFECHKDSNDGQGLRTFKYARSLAYLTKVVREPRAEEVFPDA